MLTELRMGEDPLSKKQRSFLKKTIQYAFEADNTCRQRHAAIVVKSGRVYGIGINKNLNDPSIMGQVETDSFEYARIGRHAEQAAIRGVDPSVLRGSTVYIARVTPGNRIALSKPCPRCEKILIEHGVKKVVYSDFLDEEEVELSYEELVAA